MISAYIHEKSYQTRYYLGKENIPTRRNLDIEQTCTGSTNGFVTHAAVNIDWFDQFGNVSY